MQRDGWYHVTRKRALLDAPEQIGRIAAQRAPPASRRPAVKTCECPSSSIPTWRRAWCAHVAGAASGPSLYAAPPPPRQAWPADRGTRRDHRGRRHQPGGLARRPFDGEVCRCGGTMIVDKGVLTSYLLDTYSGRSSACLDASRRA